MGLEEVIVDDDPAIPTWPVVIPERPEPLLPPPLRPTMALGEVVRSRVMLVAVKVPDVWYSIQ